MNEVIKRASKQINDPSLPRRIQLRKQINSAVMEMEYKQITLESWRNELKKLEDQWAHQQQLELNLKLAV